MLSDTILIPVPKMTLYKDTLCESLTLTGLLGAQRSSVCFFFPNLVKVGLHSSSPNLQSFFSLASFLHQKAPSSPL